MTYPPNPTLEELRAMLGIDRPAAPDPLMEIAAKAFPIPEHHYQPYHEYDGCPVCCEETGTRKESNEDDDTNGLENEL